MENQYKAKKASKHVWHYRDVSLWYFADSRRFDKWSYDVRNVADPGHAETVKHHYDPFRYRARTKAEAIEHIDEMYEKGWLV